MVIYELDRKARENGYSGEESCVTCGVYAITGGETHWAYEGYDILGWICDDCYEGGYVYMRERLREHRPGPCTLSPAARIASLTTISSTPDREQRP